MKVVIGGSGFVGRRLLSALSSNQEQPVRALVHQKGLECVPGIQFETVDGDLLKPSTLEGLVERGSVIINLSYLSACSRAENLKAMGNLIDVCIRDEAMRLVHCSTAVVAGNSGPGLVDEHTACRPVSEYERTKLEIEELLLSRAQGYFEVAILRPTAVFGPCGLNLLKLADGLSKGPALINYLKSSLFNRRSMNLVCLDNVVAALIFLTEASSETDGKVFLISDDDSPVNNYQEVESIMMEKLGVAPYCLPRIPIPPVILRSLLRLVGRPTADPAVRYSCVKLSALGFEKPCTLAEGIEQFAVWYRQEYLSPVGEIVP